MSVENVVLLLGSNMGDREAILAKARELIQERIGPMVDATNLHASEPVGFVSDNQFLNQGLVVATELTPLEVLDKTQTIEVELGRDRKTNPVTDQTGARIYADRPIDIDILYFGSQIIQTPRLEIPHPRIQERQFTLAIVRELRW